MDIQNDQQLEQVILNASEKALRAVTEDVLQRFRKDYIRRYVYESHSPNKVYKPTFEFELAWDWTQMIRTVKSISTELWYDSNKVQTFDPKRFIHGSKYSSPNDVRDNLPSILEGKRSSLWVSVSRPVKFWQQFISFMIQGGAMNKIVEKHFVAAGFTRI